MDEVAVIEAGMAFPACVRPRQFLETVEGELNACFVVTGRLKVMRRVALQS